MTNHDDFFKRVAPFLKAGVLTNADVYAVALTAARFGEDDVERMLGLAFAARAPRVSHPGVDLAQLPRSIEEERPTRAVVESNDSSALSRRTGSRDALVALLRRVAARRGGNEGAALAAEADALEAVDPSGMKPPNGERSGAATGPFGGAPSTSGETTPHPREEPWPGR